MGLMRKWYERVNLKEKLKVRDEINKELVGLNNSAGFIIKDLEGKNRALIEKNKKLAETCSANMVKLGQSKDNNFLLTGIATDLDAQVSDLHARIQRIAVAIKTAPSTKRMSQADKEAILSVVFDVPLQPAEK